MKNLATYLLESEQTYEFKIKIAGIECTNDVMDRVEHALAAFDVATVSKAKRLPICDKPLDFPSFGPVEVSLITATLKYPCTDAQIRAALGNQGRFPLANIVVVPKNAPEELRREEEGVDNCEDETKQNKKKAKALLDTELESPEGGQVQVGQKRLDSMLKELESQKLEFEKTEKTDSKTTNDTPQNNTSPSGSRKGAK